MTTLRNCLITTTLFGLLMAVSGCATLDVTPSRNLSPAAAKQHVNLGIQASGSRLRDVLQDKSLNLVPTASSTMFDKVTMLPPDARYLQPADVKTAYGTDYILSVSINDISVNGNLNPIWFPSLLMLMFKVYAPIVTFEPNVALDVTLRDATNGTVLLQKVVTENSSDHYAPMNPSEKVSGLISLTINNAMIEILRESQKQIASAGQVKR